MKMLWCICHSLTWKSVYEDVTIRDSLDTAREIQPYINEGFINYLQPNYYQSTLYSSGFFLTRASMSEAAAVTTPMCWSFNKWTMRDVHSPNNDDHDDDNDDDHDDNNGDL